MRVDNLIIDGTNIEFRVFHIAKSLDDQNFDEEQRNHIFRFLQTFYRLVEKFKPYNIYVAWDKKIDQGVPNFRIKESNGTYKLGRSKHPDIHELYEGEILLIEMLESLGVKNMFPYQLEADDICSWLVDNIPGHNVIVSSDHDLLQLVSHNTVVYNLKDITTCDSFRMKYKMDPSSFALFKAIKGDVSDNITGLKGYGDVKAGRLVKEWNTAKLTDEQRTLVEKNLRLIDLKQGYRIQQDEECKYNEQFEINKRTKHNMDKFNILCEKYNFKTIIKNMNEWRNIIKSNEMNEFIRNLI